MLLNKHACRVMGIRFHSPAGHNKVVSQKWSFCQSVRCKAVSSSAWIAYKKKYSTGEVAYLYIHKLVYIRSLYYKKNPHMFPLHSHLQGSHPIACRPHCSLSLLYQTTSRSSSGGNDSLFLSLALDNIRSWCLRTPFLHLTCINNLF